MAIFGNVSLSYTFRNTTMQLIYVHNATTWDTVFNIGFGVIITISLVIALIANPIVFLYNWRAKFSLASLLFMLMSVMDILQSFIRPVHQLFELWSADVKPLVITDEAIPKEEIALTVLMYVVCQMSISMVCLLGIVRYIQIRFPFWSYRHERRMMAVAVVFVIGECLYNTGAITIPIFMTKDTIKVWFSPSQLVWTFPSNFGEEGFLLGIWLFYCIPYYTKSGTTLIFSLLTIRELYKLRRDTDTLPEIKARSIRMVAIMNCGNFVWMVVMIAAQCKLDTMDTGKWVDYSFNYFIYFVFVMMPILLTAYNPLVVCIRSTGIRLMLKTKLSQVTTSTGWNQTVPTPDSKIRRSAEPTVSYGSTNLIESSARTSINITQR